ncbi:MAG: hypothetical protein KJ047_14320 [Anaerolineae bacterium]|nr:hypothetical protein [Anaerolineae bacterium]
MLVPAAPADSCWASAIVTTLDRAPLLAAPRLARLVCAALDGCAPGAPGRLWGYVVLPDAVRLVVGPAEGDALSAFVERVKVRTAGDLLTAIRQGEDVDALDAVLRFNPAWGGAIYRVWAAGFHCAPLWTEYKLSGALYALRQTPLRAGLVARAADWPYQSHPTPLPGQQ